jgi:hypothetical protein
MGLKKKVSNNHPGNLSTSLLILQWPSEDNAEMQVHLAMDHVTLQPPLSFPLFNTHIKNNHNTSEEFSQSHYKTFQQVKYICFSTSKLFTF